MAPSPPKTPKPTSTRLRAGSKSPAKKASTPAPPPPAGRTAGAGEPSGKKQASRRAKAEPMLPKVRLTAEVLAGG